MNSNSLPYASLLSKLRTYLSQVNFIAICPQFNFQVSIKLLLKMKFDLLFAKIYTQITKSAFLLSILKQMNLIINTNMLNFESVMCTGTVLPLGMVLYVLLKNILTYTLHPQGDIGIPTVVNTNDSISKYYNPIILFIRSLLLKEFRMVCVFALMTYQIVTFFKENLTGQPTYLSGELFTLLAQTFQFLNFLNGCG